LITAQHAASLPLGTGSFPITAFSGGSPLAGARVALLATGQDYVTAITGPTGSVTVPFDPESTGTFLATITRPNRRIYTAQVAVTAGTGAFLSIQGTSLDDDGAGGTSGNSDGRANAGETVDIEVVLRNTGTAAATGVEGSLVVETGGTHVQVLGGPASYGTIAAGSTAVASHRVHLLPTAPPGFQPRFRIDVTSDQEPWSDTFLLPVYTVRIEHYGHVWSDPVPSGNGNGVIEPGESINYTVEIRNVGDGQATGVEGELRVLNAASGQTDPEVTVTDGLASFGTLDPNEREIGDFAFDLSGAAVPSELRLELTVSGTYGPLAVARTDLALPPSVDSLRAVGSVHAIRVMWDPASVADLLGYDIYRAPAAGGPYARVNSHTVVGSTFFEDSPLPTLTRFYYQIAVRDSSANQGPFSATISASTNPPLASGWPIETSQVTTSGPQIYDFDRDGLKELVMGSDYIYAWRANGTEVRDGDNDPRTSGPFTNLGFDPAIGFRSDPAIADLDRDGSFEIIMAGWGAQAGQGYVHVIGPNGTARPGWPRTLTFPFNWSSVAVGQIDADDKLEVVTMQGQNGILYAFNHDGSELLDGDANPSTIGPFFRTNTTFDYASPALGNFDGDPLDEIVIVTNSPAGQVFVLDGNGVALSGWPQSTGGQITASPVIADLDGVAPPEIVVAAEDDSVYVFRGNGGRYPGWPRRAKVFTTDSRTASPAVVDLDGDGFLDILFPGNDGVFHVWRRDGSVLPGWENVLFAIDALSSFATQASPTVGDVDGDNELEVLLGAENGKLYGWNRNGTEMAGFPIQLEGEVRSGATIADFDADGLCEIALSGWDQNVYVWDMPGAYDYERVPWPSFRHDLRNTGNVATSVVIGVEPAAEAARARFRLGSAAPNPFHPSTEVALDVPPIAASAPVLVRIYDVSGRLARELHQGPLTAGTHRFRWDGRDQKGRPVAGGVYFLRATGPGFEAAEKLVLVR
jgi:hypothetical protein